MTHKKSCARCGSAQSAGASVCPRCGDRQIAGGDPNAQYGMLDLGGAADVGGGPALDMDDAPARPRPRAGSASIVRRPGAGARPDSQSLDGARRTTSGSRADSQSLEAARNGTGARPGRGSDANARTGTLGGGAAPKLAGPRSGTLGGERKATSRSGAIPAADPGRAGTGARAARAADANANGRAGTLGGAPAGRASATSRSGMMSQVAAGKPAPVQRSGTLGGENAARPGAPARSGTLHALSPAPATGAHDQAASYGRGMMLDDNPFNDAFAGGQNAPALELETDGTAPAVEESVPPPEPPPVEQTPEQSRSRAIVDIAKYGPRPTSPLQQPLYWFRVMSRKRVLSEELVALSAQRKRADDQAQEALVALAEALLALRGSPELAALDKQFAAVEDAEHRVGHAAKEGQKRRQDVNQELTRLKADSSREPRRRPRRCASTRRSWSRAATS